MIFKTAYPFNALSPEAQTNARRLHPNQSLDLNLFNIDGTPYDGRTHVKAYASMEPHALHQNFLLIHEFLYPDQPLKAWVKNSPDYTHSYHDQWDLLMELLSSLATHRNQTILQTLNYLKNAYYPEEDFNTKKDFYLACVYEIRAIVNSRPNS